MTAQTPCSQDYCKVYSRLLCCLFPLARPIATFKTSQALNECDICMVLLWKAQCSTFADTSQLWESSCKLWIRCNKFGRYIYEAVVVDHTVAADMQHVLKMLKHHVAQTPDVAVCNARTFQPGTHLLHHGPGIEWQTPCPQSSCAGLWLGHASAEKPAARSSGHLPPWPALTHVHSASLLPTCAPALELSPRRNVHSVPFCVFMSSLPAVCNSMRKRRVC